MAGEIKTGTFTGTGAAIDFELGWVPDYVLVENITDGDESFAWYAGMTNGHALKTAADGTKTRITSNGVTPRNPTNFSGKKGFTAGTALSENGKLFGYIAIRNAEY